MVVKLISAVETYPLRIKILRNGIAENYTFQGDDVSEAFHFGAFIQENCVGIVTCLPVSHTYFEDKNAYQLRGMAVDKEWQSSGIGKALLLKTLAVVTHRKATLIWCNARMNAVGFYEKMGFSIMGDSFYIPHIGLHYVMYRKI